MYLVDLQLESLVLSMIPLLGVGQISRLALAGQM